MNGMLRHRGDVALARAAATAGIPFTLSTFSNVQIEALATKAGGRLWMQLYIMKDRSIARNIIRRAEGRPVVLLVWLHRTASRL